MKTKKLIALAALCVAGSYASAQDLIVKKDGSVIQAKVTKIGTSEVEYKKWSNQNGPQYSIAVADILAINYQNGEKETFENVGANLTANETPSNNDAKVNPIEEKPVASADNAELIAKYNNQVVQSRMYKAKEKQAKCLLPIYGLTSNSIISDENLCISIQNVCPDFDRKKPQAGGGVQGYVIKLTNKTNSNIYIDLANTFKIDDRGNSTPYYSNKTYTVSSSSSSGGSLNVGAVANTLGIGGAVGTLANGVNVGGGSTGGTTVSQTEERIIIIPPQGTASLPLEKVAQKKTIIELPEVFVASIIPSINVNLNEYKDICTEQNSTSIYKRIITYSTCPDFKSYKRLNVGFFLKGVLGCKSSTGVLGLICSPHPSLFNATDWNYLILGCYYER